ncbi:hypothetical protein BUE80_DR011324 [Diplocarpon rosae]|nr:hypothetical protein BUE80_DR011324 [Diplocarpon rosae]
MQEPAQTETASKRISLRKKETLRAAIQYAKIKSPASALARYLDLKQITQRRAFWNSIKLSAPIKTLPAILTHYLHLSSTPEVCFLMTPLSLSCADTKSQVEWDNFDHLLRSEATAHLERRGFRTDDLAQWAWILSANCPDEAVNRFTSISSELPMFLFLEILRNDLQYVESLEKVIHYVWEYPLKRCTDAAYSPDKKNAASKVLDDLRFSIMMSRLLTQVRRIWPSAMSSVAQMVSTFVDSLVAVRGGDPGCLSGSIHAQICKVINHMFPLLALPASINPLQSMMYNWNAQKVLLKLAGQYNPPLLLDKDSYQAVTRVLLASRKTEAESKVVARRLRTWPPWRSEQDGMDAQRPPDDDLSRVLLASFRTNEAGYRENSDDLAMKILGGQEMDGTPTIHTRHLIKHRPKRPAETSAELEGGFDQKVWAARVEATRDVREAWRAFVVSRDMGGKPKQALYLAMFRKLNSELARQGRTTEDNVPAGDGIEVLPVPDDNMSDFYKTHNQPPTFNDLYDQMISSGLRPHGNCLYFLVRHARTPAQGLIYLRDSGLNRKALSSLCGIQENDDAPEDPLPGSINSVEGPLLDAFIHLICRSAPRAVPAISERAKKYKLRPVATIAATESNASQQDQWCIQEVFDVPFLPCLHDPIQHAIRLLQETQTTFRPAWYSLFKALARRDVVVSREHIRGARNSELAWQLTKDAFRNFQASGLELDPDGFIWICHSFFKFGEAAQTELEKYEAPLVDGAQLLKDEFAKLCRSKKDSNLMPRLRHNIKPVILHMYVRCMGLAGELDEIVSVLGWMVNHLAELDESINQADDGLIMLTRILIAARISCYGTEHEEIAKELVKKVDEWIWPDEGELESYSSNSSSEEVRSC